MTYECFEVEVADHVAHLRLSRPDELNTMNPTFFREVREIVEGISEEASARVVVISSTGRHFTAGMDLAVFTTPSSVTGDGTAETGRQRAQVRLAAKRIQESFNALERARVPVIAAVHGGCVGGGVDLVSACDLRYATTDAFFVIQEINIGMTADLGTLQRLPKLIPPGVVRELAYTGQRMPAQRAYEVGLVNGLFDSHDDLVDGALEVAGEIAKRTPLAIWGTKEMLNYARDHSVEDGLDYIATWQTGMFQPADLIEGITAQAEKRDPDYDDLLPAPRDLD